MSSEIPQFTLTMSNAGVANRNLNIAVGTCSECMIVLIPKMFFWIVHILKEPIQMPIAFYD